jgi:hypothetical protein
MPTDFDNTNAGKRRTMVKDRVGCVRTSTRNLPRGHFTYGMKYTPDAEGAGDGTPHISVPHMVLTLSYSYVYLCVL